VVSDDVGHFKRDDGLELTRWSRLQADRPYKCIRIIEVLSCETPPTLCDRRVECPSPGKPHVGRAFSLVDRCVAKVILDPLYQDFSHHVWSRLQADHAHICIRIIEATSCETPPTLCDRRVECPSRGKPHVGRAFVDSHHVFVRAIFSAHGSLRRGKSLRPDRIGSTGPLQRE